MHAQSNSFFLTYSAQYFAHYLAVFSTHKSFFLVNLQLAGKKNRWEKKQNRLSPIALIVCA